MPIATRQPITLQAVRYMFPGARLLLTNGYHKLLAGV